MSISIDGTNGIVLADWSTAARPTIPQAGQIGYNTTGKNAEVYTGATWLNLNKIINVSQVVKTDTFISASTSWANVTGLLITVTPTNANSKFLLVSDISVGPNSGAGSYSQRFARDGNVITGYIGDAASTRPRAMGLGYAGDSAGIAAGVNITKMYLDSPATTANVTYTIQVAGSTTVPGYINRTQSDRDVTTYDARTASSFTIFEIGI